MLLGKYLWDRRQTRRFKAAHTAFEAKTNVRYRRLLGAIRETPGAPVVPDEEQEQVEMKMMRTPRRASAPHDTTGTREVPPPHYGSSVNVGCCGGKPHNTLV